MKQLGGFAQREDRLAMAVLILDEFEGSPVGAKSLDRFAAIGQHQGSPCERTGLYSALR